jgi:glycosyltransferase involved in cell wall biosynthesis
MRIAVVAACPFPSPQGSQVFVGEMCEALARRDHDVELLTYGQGGENTQPARSFAHRRIRRLPGDDALRSGPTLVKPALDLLLARELSRMLANERFDVVHAHNYEAGAVAVATRFVRGVPVVYHSHSAMAEELPSYFATRAAKRCAVLLGAGFDRTVPRSADHVIALSAEAASAMRAAGVREQDLSVVPPALADVGEGPARDEARRALGLAVDRFVVGYCGNLDAYQDLDIVAEAIARMGSVRPASAPLWLLVTHALDARFERMLDRSGAARWTKVILARSFSEVRAGMAACDALALPRRSPSGFPIKLLNYLAAARPVVTGIAGERLLGAEAPGCIAAGAGVERWIDVLQRLRADPHGCAVLGTAARRRFVTDYTWNAVLPVLERIYGKATGRSGAARPVVPVLR